MTPSESAAAPYPIQAEQPIIDALIAEVREVISE